MTNITKNLGKRLQEIRIMRNLTQTELAELVGLEPMSISRMETGLQYPKPENLDKLSKALKVDIKDFFDFRHYKSKKELEEIFIGLIKQATVKDLQYYIKLIYCHQEYMNKSKLGKS